MIQADTYNPVYSKEVTNNIGYKLRGHVTKDSSTGGSASGSWSLN